MPNVVKIDQSITELSRFFDFLGWQLAPFLIFKIHSFYWHMRSGGLSCIIVTNFIRIGQSIAEICSTFQDVCRRHLGFWKFSNFIGWRVLESHARCNITPNFVKI